MNEISTKVKKLNMFQLARKKMFLIKNFRSIKIEDIEKLPNYIKNDKDVILKFFEENAKLLEKCQNSVIIAYLDNKQLEQCFNVFSLEKKTSLAEEYYNELFDIIIKDGEILEKLIQNRKFEIFCTKKLVKMLTMRYIEEGYQDINIGNKYIFSLEDLIDIIPEESRTEFGKKLVSDLDNPTIMNHKELIKYLPEERQVEIISLNDSLIQYSNEQSQLECVKKYPEKLHKACFNVQWQYMEEDFKNRFKETSKEFQIAILKKTDEGKIHYSENIPQGENLIVFFENASISVQQEILQGKEYKDILDKIVMANPEKYLKIADDKYQYLAIKENPQLYDFATLDVKKGAFILDSETIQTVFENRWYNDRDKFFYDGTAGAKGTLLSDRSNTHDNSIFVNDRPWENGTIVKEMPIEQFVELLKIDSNYILPRCNGGNKSDCIAIFDAMYGEEMTQKCIGIIDKIYEMQSLFNESKVYENGIKKYYPRTIKSASKIPLQYLKILFNEKIMTSNTLEDIMKYFEGVSEENFILNGNGTIHYEEKETTKEQFKKLIKNAYGEDAVRILDSRIELDVHEINSLEIFDERILNNFPIEFVNDLISYNFEGFSGFLNIIKNPERLEVFKQYYDILSSIVGKNAETMQKAMQEFYYCEKLFKNSKDVELSDKQIENLFSVVCSNANQFKIETLEQLENFDKIADQKLQEHIERQDREEILINLFGNEVFDAILRYDISTETLKNTILDEDERKILEAVLFVKNAPIMESVNMCKGQSLPRIPIALYSGLNKLKEHQLEIYNSTFLTKEKMEEMISKFKNDDITEEQKKDLPIYKECIDGIDCYHINGVPFAALYTNPSLGQSEFGLNEYINYEGQNSNNAICCNYVNSKVKSNFYLAAGGFVYTKIPPDGLIITMPQDAATSHGNKEIKMYGQRGSTVSVNNAMYIANETAIYRRYREHNERKNEELGGRIIPDFVVCDKVPEKTEGEYFELLRKYNIAIMIIHREKYLEPVSKGEEEHER